MFFYVLGLLLGFRGRPEKEEEEEECVAVRIIIVGIIIKTQEISILPSTPNDFWTNFSTQVGLLRFFGSSQTLWNLLQSLDAFKVSLYLINNKSIS